MNPKQLKMNKDEDLPMTLQLAKGVQDIPPEEKIIQNKLITTLQMVFERYGFAPLETPIIERYDTLAQKGGAGEESDASKEIFKLTDQGKRKLALRFELTTSLARFVAMNPTLKMPFKRYEIGPVFRDGPIKAGRTRQFYQCDCDTIGVESMLADAELLAIVQDVFNKLNLDVVIKVNNRKILNGMLEQVGIQDKENAIIAIDKLEKIGQKGVEKELQERGIAQENITQLFTILQKGMTLAQLRAKLTDKEGIEGLEETQELFDYLIELGVNKAQFDVSLARGLGYYTGPIFEVFLTSGKVTSSLLGGGRYDKMIGDFLGGKKQVPAVGISFGIVPIMVSLLEQEKVKEKTPAQVYVIPIKTVKQSLAIAQQLRKAKITVSMDLAQKSVGKNLDYASKLGIPYVLLIGEKELKEQKVTLRNMQTGDELTLSIKEAIKKLQ